MTAALLADETAVSWRWNDSNDSNSSILTCVRSIRIIYQPVGSSEERHDVSKFRTTHTFPNWQCNMGCAITVNTLGVNGTITSKTCTTSEYRFTSPGSISKIIAYSCCVDVQE